MINFPSIKLFENVVRNVKHRTTYVGQDENDQPIYDGSRIPPVLDFKGHVKLHGTNAAIVLDTRDMTFSFQSREREITVLDDNAGFARHMTRYVDDLYKIFATPQKRFPEADKIAIFGEWCGGNIQKGVGISGLDKMFVVFGIRYVKYNDTPEPNMIWDLGDFSFVKTPEAKIYSIQDFPSFDIQIDFNKPYLSVDPLIEMTLKVEEECPVAKEFGNSGIGEGIVFKCTNPGYEDSGFWFKSKGEKHSVSKVNKLKTVDVEGLELINSFVEASVTENRLEWAIQNLVREKRLPIEMTSMGEFIRIVYNDVMKEEMDAIIELQLDPKKLGGPIANKARPWFIGQFNSGRTE